MEFQHCVLQSEAPLSAQPRAQTWPDSQEQTALLLIIPAYASAWPFQVLHSDRAILKWALRASGERRLLARVRELEAGEQRLQALEASVAVAAQAEAAAAAAAAQACAAAKAAEGQDAAAAAGSSATDKPPGCEVAAPEARACGSGSAMGSAPTALGADALYNHDWVRRARRSDNSTLDLERKWKVC